MAKRSKSRDDYDSPWKEALQAYLPFFLAFFFADIHEDIDWSRGYESLDKEFQQIVAGPRSANVWRTSCSRSGSKTAPSAGYSFTLKFRAITKKNFPNGCSITTSPHGNCIINTW